MKFYHQFPDSALNNWILPLWILLLVSSASCDTSHKADLPSIKELEASFADPPASAKPWTWWHWIDGNVTKNDITSDLEAMERAGLGAALIFNVKLGFPDGPARFMSEGWLELLDHAAVECDRLGFFCWNDSEEGWIDVDWFRYEYDGPKAARTN